jgi:hypothetical protein
VTVVDTANGAVVRQLRFPHQERWKGCCGVVGWLDERRLVLTSRGDGPGRLLVWDIESDALSRLVEFDGGHGVARPALATTESVVVRASWRGIPAS